MAPQQFSCELQTSILKFLYNLEKDPQEKNNEIANYPEIAEELHILMKQILENGRSTPGEKQENEFPMDGSQWQQINAITGT